MVLGTFIVVSYNFLFYFDYGIIQQIQGKSCTVVANTETGKLVTVYPKK